MIMKVVFEVSAREASESLRELDYISFLKGTGALVNGPKKK